MFANPIVGKTVQVTTRFRNHVITRPGEWVDSTYVGTVGKDDKTVPQGSFKLLCLSGPMPIRMIALERIVNLSYLDGTPAGQVAAQTEFKTWEVAGSKGNTYVVTERAGQRSCDCPGFTFRKMCKHIKMV